MKLVLSVSLAQASQPRRTAGLLGVGVGVSRLECGWPLDGAAKVDSIIVACFKEPTAAEGKAIFDSNILITGACELKEDASMVTERALSSGISTLIR